MKIKRPHQCYINTNFRQNPFTIQNSKILFFKLTTKYMSTIVTIVNNLRVGKGKSSIKQIKHLLSKLNVTEEQRSVKIKFSFSSHQLNWERYYSQNGIL